MKILSTLLLAFVLVQSCATKNEAKQFSSIIKDCDELDIVYYTKDPFVYKTIDTAEINFFKELVTLDNEKISDTCQSTGQLIYKNKGQNILIADLSTKNIKDSISCEYVTYSINNKRYRHRLTYRHGMSIDAIYWRKVDPTGNPSTGLDTTKFKYKDYKNNR
jgi:hypothetical protein